MTLDAAAMSGAHEILKRTAESLLPHADDLVAAWARALLDRQGGPKDEIQAYCRGTVDTLLRRLARGEAEEFLRSEQHAATAAAQAGTGLQPIALAIGLLDRCCLPFLMESCPDRDSLAAALLALDEFADRRLELLLHAQEEEVHHKLAELQDAAASAEERARELERANEEIKRAQARSQRRAEQIALFALVARRLAAILEPEKLLQAAAETIQGKLNYNYVAVTVLDNEGVLLGRWSARPGVNRRSAGRKQGPVRGLIGRALRQRAPLIVGDVRQDSDYEPDVEGTCAEMVVPLIDEGQAVGALDFQSDTPGVFDLDDVAVAEAIAEFLVVALRNARLFEEARRDRA